MKCLGCNGDGDLPMNVFTIYDQDVQFHFGYEVWYLCYKCLYELNKKALVKCATCGQGYLVEKSMIAFRLDNDFIRSIIHDTIVVRFMLICPECAEEE